MKTDPYRKALIVGVALILASQRNASASLFATFNLNQALYEYGAQYQQYETETTPVSDTAVPFQQTVSQTTATNSVTTTYNPCDNGTTAGLTINSSAYITAVNETVDEGTPSDLVTFNSSNATFSFTQTVNYTIGYQAAGTEFAGEFDIMSSLGFLAYSPALSPSTFSQSGTLPAGVVYSMDEF